VNLAIISPSSGYSPIPFTSPLLILPHEHYPPGKINVSVERKSGGAVTGGMRGTLAGFSGNSRKIALQTRQLAATLNTTHCNTLLHNIGKEPYRSKDSPFLQGRGTVTVHPLHFPPAIWVSLSCDLSQLGFFFGRVAQHRSASFLFRVWFHKAMCLVIFMIFQAD